MRTMRYSVLAFLFAAALAAQESPIREGCDSGDKALGTVRQDTPVHVLTALAMGQTCYHVTAEIEGKVVDGYMLNANHPAIERFEREREEISKHTTAAPPPPPPAAVPNPAAPPPPKKLLSPTGEVFSDVSGTDLFGKYVSTSKIHGKAVLVCFWGSRGNWTQREFRAVNDVYSQYHGKGLEAVGFSENRNVDLARAALDDSGVDWPQLTDKYGLATKLGVPPGTGPYVVLLGPNKEVLAKGLKGDDLRTAVQEVIGRR